MADPIHQFQITKIFTLGHIGGHEIAFTNSSAYMVGAVAVISLFMLGGSAAAASFRAASSRSPKCPMSSSPHAAHVPARRA